MRLIDADEIRYTDLSGGLELCYVTSKDRIDGMPTVEAEPVRHGEWVMSDCDRLYCSNCDAIAINKIIVNGGEVWELDIRTHMRYCPKCGAKMDLNHPLIDFISVEPL